MHTSTAFGCTRQSVLDAVSSRRVTGSATSPRTARENKRLALDRRTLDHRSLDSRRLPEVRSLSLFLYKSPLPLKLPLESPPLPSVPPGLLPPISPPLLPPLTGMARGSTSACTSVLPARLSWSRRPCVGICTCRPARQPAATSSALPRTSRASSSSSTATRPRRMAPALRSLSHRWCTLTKTKRTARALAAARSRISCHGDT